MSIKSIETNKIKGGISILGIIFLTIILVLILSYFNVNIKAVVESPNTQENINYVSGGGKSLWNDYLKKPAEYLWNDVWKKIFWASFISNMEKIRDGKPTDMQNMAPTVNFK